MTRALVTNDDGIRSPGLCELARIARGLGWDVVVAAPAVESSGSSAAITGTGTVAVTGQDDAGRTDRSMIRVERRELDTLPGVPAYAVHAAPALIALLAAHGAFGAIPDVVLSGINRGANLGHAILHSGTAGAALTGGLNGARAAAVSLDVGLDPAHHHWDAAAPVLARLLPDLLGHPPGTVLNVNVPNATPGTAVEVREARLAGFGIVQTTMTEGHEGAVRLTVRELPDQPADGTDAALLAAGYATVTSIVAVREATAPALTMRA